MVKFSIYFDGKDDVFEVWFKKMGGSKGISKIWGLNNLKSGIIPSQNGERLHEEQV